MPIPNLGFDMMFDIETAKLCPASALRIEPLGLPLVLAKLPPDFMGKADPVIRLPANPPIGAKFKAGRYWGPIFAVTLAATAEKVFNPRTADIVPKLLPPLAVTGIATNLAAAT